ncbi:MAG: winged helix-turn-helix transcriptional regulator [Candidatus Aenigmatarchaeota archaeon]
MLACERFAKRMPSIRAMIAKELVSSYNLSQAETARILGVTQGAISQYIRRLRGKEIIDYETKTAIRELCKNVINGSNFENEICMLCKRLIIR